MNDQEIRAMVEARFDQTFGAGKPLALHAGASAQRSRWVDFAIARYKRASAVTSAPPAAATMTLASKAAAPTAAPVHGAVSTQPKPMASAPPRKVQRAAATQPKPVAAKPVASTPPRKASSSESAAEVMALAHLALREVRALASEEGEKNDDGPITVEKIVGLLKRAADDPDASEEERAAARRMLRQYEHEMETRARHEHAIARGFTGREGALDSSQRIDRAMRMPGVGTRRYIETQRRTILGK
jgi:hypothetical protein